MTLSVGLVLWCATNKQGISIPVRFVRASRLAQRIRQVQPDVRVESDDARRILVVYAGREVAETIQTYANLFDVQPRRVLVRWKLVSVADNVASKTVTQVLNGAKWHCEDPHLEVKLSLLPRVNDDNSITLWVSTMYRSRRVESVIRCGMKDRIIIRPGYLALMERQLAGVSQSVLNIIRQADERAVPTGVLELPAIMSAEEDWSEKADPRGSGVGTPNG